MTAAPEQSWNNALRWASFAAQFDPAYCITAFRGAFRVLPEILWIGHSIPVRHDAVNRLDISQTTSTATKICINLSDLGSAVEIIEQGLGTVYQQILQLKIATDGLPPEQAQSFQHLSTELYTRGSDPSMSLANDRNKLIEDIRKQPGFEFFLLPRPYKVLCQAAQGGPVVILNSHQDSCDGIIILSSTEAVHVALPNVTLNLLHSQRITLQNLHGRRVRGESASTRLFAQQEGWLSTAEQFETMLTWLWSFIVSPVYQALQLVSEMLMVNSHDIDPL
jgi:hypothetical protein